MGKLPLATLYAAVKRGIAPAMHCMYDDTFWGQDVQNSEENKKLLGYGEEVPEELFVAIAQILAYIYQLEQFRKGTSGRPKALPDDLPIPEEFRYDSWFFGIS